MLPTAQDQELLLGYLRSFYCILMVPMGFVATLVVLHFGRNPLLYGSRLSTNIFYLSTTKIVPLGPQDTKYPSPTFSAFSIQEKELEASKLQ